MVEEEEVGGVAEAVGVAGDVAMAFERLAVVG